MSLRWRIALALAAVAAATTISVGIVSYRATSMRLLEEVDRSLDQAWETIAVDPASAARNRGLLDVFVIQTIGTDGIVIRTNADDPIGPGPGVDDAVDRPSTRHYDTVGTPSGTGKVRLLTVGVRGGAIQVGRPLVENERVLGDLGRRTVWLVALVTVGAAALGWLIARSVSGPLVRLTRATDVERSGRLDVAVPVAGRDEVGRLGTAFNGMLGALAASRDDQRRLVEDAGHELRTPLTSVRTNLAVLRRHPDLDAETRGKVLDDLYAETEELVVLVEEVVELARGATDDAPPERVELGPLAAAQAARERRHGRPVSVTADDSVVVAPPPALERAISNLIDNAAKFDPSGGPIDVEVHDGAVTVLDRGPGIATADRDRVFDRFYRAEGARSLPGSGLGLSIVREVAVRSGGTVEVADRPAGGTAVTIRLPRGVERPGPIGSSSMSTYIVGIDGSEHGMAALDWARSTATADEKIIVAHAWEVAVVTGYEAVASIDPMTLETVAEDFLDEAVAGCDDPRVEGRLVAGNAGRNLVELAEEVGGDVAIVVGHGGTSKASLLLGSTASHVIHHTEAPVVVVRGENRLPVRRVVVGVDEGHHRHHDDPDVPSIAALRWATRLPGVERIELFHADFVPAVAAGPVREPGLESDEEVVAEDHLLQVAIGAATDGTGTAPNGAAIVPVVAGGTGAFALIEASRTVDLVIMGTRGRRGLVELIAGSTSLEVTAHSHCPVAVIR